nr:hypothetical protein [Chryseobacterium gleum]
MTANSEDIFNTSGLGFQDSPKSPIAIGKMGYSNVHRFLRKNRRRMEVPKRSFLKLFLKIKTELKKTRTGNHIIVGFIAKTNVEKAKRRVVFLLPVMSSFKIINEKIIPGRSGLGDCENSSRTGRKQR